MQFVIDALMDAFVITGDVQNSRAVRDFPRRRDRVLAQLSKSQRDRGWVDADYAVTAWDEFQMLLIRPEALPWAVWEIYRAFQPAMALRLGIGGGRVERTSATAPINETATGEAFILAREALERLASPRRGAGQARLAVATCSATLTHALGAALRLVDVLAADITETQWRVISAFERYGRQDRVARALGRNESTISRSLAAARYWDLQATLTDLEALLQQSGCALQSNRPEVHE
jgi:hypothetical protein